MINSRIKISVASIAALVGGVFAGSAIAATNDSSAPEPQEAAVGKYQDELEPYTVLENGKTAGNYRIDTPLAERPDFVPTRLPGGVKGYLRVQDFDPRTDSGTRDGLVDVKVLSKDESDRLRAGAIGAAKPNAQGQILAPVFAKDGKTVVGQQLMNPPE